MGTTQGPLQYWTWVPEAVASAQWGPGSSRPTPCQVLSPDPGLLPLSTHPIGASPFSTSPPGLRFQAGWKLRPVGVTSAGSCCSPERLDGAILLPASSTSQRPFWCSSSALFCGGFVLVGSWLLGILLPRWTRLLVYQRLVGGVILGSS